MKYTNLYGVHDNLEDLHSKAVVDPQSLVVQMAEGRKKKWETTKWQKRNMYKNLREKKVAEEKWTKLQKKNIGIIQDK